MRVLSSIVLLLLVISCVIAAPCDSYSYINRVDVSTTAELTSALGAALPGDLIVLADGTYTKTFTTTGVSGTQANPIILCGGVNAIITAGSQTSSSAALRFFNSNYWVLTGFSVTNAKKGVELETANYFVVDGLTITNIGGQCVYLKTTATNNVIKNSVISGCSSGSNGKGIYIGANAAGDASNYNSVIDNVFSGTTAENLDVRDSTIGTQVVRNIFSGDATAASIGQIVAIRGNNAAVTNNTFINGQNAFKYGLRTSSVSFNGVLWGNLNVFSGNYFDVPQATDNSLYIHNYKADGSGNVVYCNNEGIPLANGKPFTNDDRGCTELPHEEEPTTPPVATPAPTTAPTAAPTYDFETPARPNGTTPYKTCSSFYALRTVQVSTASELASALADATAGDVIVLADGVYNGQFVSEYKSGTEANPIVLCGTNNAVLTTNSVVTGSALEIHFASHWYLSGFTIYNSKKGLQFETVQHSTIDGLFAYFIGEEAVHIKLNSSYNTIKNSVISYTGENTASDRRGYGEGVYVGTSEGNGAWDRSDYNQLLFNYIGPNVTAEGADIKEYTTGTFVYGNIFNGYGLSGMNSATTVLAMKGNYGIARNNSFYFAIDYATRTSYRSGWGNYNVYDGNRAYVPGAKSGYYIHYPTSDGSGNVVLCNNWVYGSTAFANNGVVCKDSVPVAVPNATTDTCSSVVTFTHTLANQWSDGRYVYSQFNVAISNSQPIHSLNFKASFEIFNNLVRKESDRTFVLADDREYIPAGSGFTFSYVVQGTEKATITVLSGDCAPLPVTCAITVTQKKLNSWSDNRADFYQYGFDFTSNRNVASNTLDLTITLPTGAYPTGQWNLATSDSTATILATSTVHYTASLWGLQPGGSFYGAHGYTITVPRGTVVSNPLFVVNGCN